MSQKIWKRDDVQLVLAEKLLKEFSASGDVELFEVKVADGVEMVCWGMKRIAKDLKRLGKIVEVGIDATCKRLRSLAAHE